MRLILSLFFLLSFGARAEKISSELSKNLRLDFGSLVVLDQHIKRSAKGNETLITFKCHPSPKKKAKHECRAIDLKYLNTSKQFKFKRPK